MSKINRLANRTKLFTMGPKTQRNLFFSGKTIEKKGYQPLGAASIPFLQSMYNVVGQTTQKREIKQTT